MNTFIPRLLPAIAATLALLAAAAAAQTHGEKEEFVAIAVVNNEIATGAERVLIQVSRWSPASERTRLANTLVKEGPRAMLSELSRLPSVGTIRTPDTLAYDLRFAHQTPLPEGGRRIVMATDRPISFWETVRNSRTLDYPFTVVQMELDRNGQGKGTLSIATKILAHDNIIELEHFGTTPVMLTQIESRRAN